MRGKFFLLLSLLVCFAWIYLQPQRRAAVHRATRITAATLLVASSAALLWHFLRL